MSNCLQRIDIKTRVFLRKYSVQYYRKLCEDVVGVCSSPLLCLLRSGTTFSVFFNTYIIPTSQQNLTLDLAKDPF